MAQGRNKLPFYIQSVLTRPANTTAYTANQAVASNTSAGSAVIPSFNLSSLLDAGAEFIEVTRGRLIASQGFGATAAQFKVDLFNVKPTLTNGDGGTYLIATGAAGNLGRLISEISSATTAGTDGTALDMCPGSTAYSQGYAGVPIVVSRTQLLYWTLDAIVGFTPLSAGTFTLALQGYRY